MTEEYELNPITSNSSVAAANSSSSVSVSNSKAEYLITQLNAANAKKLAVLVVIGFIAYHGILNWQYGECGYCYSNILFIKNVLLYRQRFLSMAFVQGTL